MKGAGVDALFPCPSCGKPAHEGRCRPCGRPSLPDLLEALAAYIRREEAQAAERAKPRPLVKPAEIARWLSIDEATVYRLIRSGSITGVRIASGAVRVEEAELERFIRVRRAA